MGNLYLGWGGERIHMHCMSLVQYFGIKYYIFFCKLGVLLFLPCWSALYMCFLSEVLLRNVFKSCEDNNHPFWQMQREVHSWARQVKMLSHILSEKSWTLASSLVIWTRGYSDFPSCKTSKSCSSCSEKRHVIIIMSFGFSNKQSATDVQLGFSGWAASGREWDRYRGRCWHFYRTKPWTAGRITGMWGEGDNNRRIRNKDRHLFLNLLILCWMISYNRNK